MDAADRQSPVTDCESHTLGSTAAAIATGKYSRQARFERLGYTPWKKISYCRAQSRPLQHFAALGRKKKAIKVLGIAGTDGLRWPDFEIVSEPSGKPVMLLHGEA